MAKRYNACSIDIQGLVVVLEDVSRSFTRSSMTSSASSGCTDAEVPSTEAGKAIEILAGLGKAAGDVNRLTILRVLKTDSLGVLELAHIIQIRQPALSHHLKVMTKSGLVTARKEGNAIFYRRTLPSTIHFGQYIAAIFAEVDQLPLGEQQQERLDEIRQQRAEQSQRFFAKNSQTFRRHQEMIADHSLYAQNILKLIECIALPSYQYVVEIGPGEGLFLSSLANRFKRVIALDNSEVMLGKASSYMHELGLRNVMCVLGEANDLCHCPWNLFGKVDCIVINMVLHHVPVPAVIFKQVAALLKAGGSLLVSELSAHDQSWVQQSCGDLWLGFSPEELDGWASEAGLVAKESQYLALRNGFQVQIRRFFQPKNNRGLN